MTLKVGIVGAGRVGQTLGKKIARNHPVVFGVRETGKHADVSKRTNIQVMTVSDAIKTSDVIILAVPGANDDAGITALAASLSPDIKGKVLIDATNPLTPYPSLEVRWSGISGGELLAEALPDATVYKAFNTIGVDHMEHPDGSAITGQQLTMLFAGGPDRREQVEEVIAAVGFTPKYIGPIRYARNLEALAELWIHLALPGVGTAANWGRNFHFQVLSS